MYIKEIHNGVHGNYKSTYSMLASCYYFVV